MTSREKLLAMAAGGLVAVVGAATLVKNNIIEPLEAKRRQVVSLRSREAELNGKLAGKPTTDTAWRKMLGHAIALESARAHLMFREDVHTMLTRSGLTIAAVQPRQARESKSGFREGFVELPLTVNANGTLEQVVGFLREFYQKPYFARVESMSLTPESSAAAKAAKGAAKAEEPRLNVNMQLSALILPKRFGPKEGPIPPGEDDRRLSEQELAAFDEIHQNNLFRLYAPPPVAVKPPDDATPTKPVESVKPAPPERPDVDKLTLVGMNSSWPNLYVYIADERKKNDAPKRFTLNDAIDNGRLIMVHPRGMVVRVREKNGATHTDYFYPIGRKFSQREKLDVKEHPAIVRELSSFMPEG